MGGFEGGDEGGFWDEDALALLVKNQKKRTPTQKKNFYTLHNDGSYTAKANKTLKFVPCSCESFTLETSYPTSMSASYIFKAFKLLDSTALDSDIMDFFTEYKVILSGDENTLNSAKAVAQNTAVFLLLTKEVCNLVMSKDELLHVAKSFNEDVMLSLLDYQSKLV